MMGGLMAVIGACFGSFAGVIVDRMQRGLSIVLPRSHCSACGTNLKIWHNIPIISWLGLRGRCATCGASIGIRLLFIEAIFALALFSLYWKLGFSLALFEKFIFVFLLICLAYIDMDTFMLPLSLMIALVVSGLIFSAAYFFYPHAYVAAREPWSFLSLLVIKHSPIFSLTNRVLGALVGFLSLSSVNLVATMILRKTGRLTREQWAMGFGDPILALGIGLTVGASHMVLVIFLASAFGSLVGISNLFVSRDEGSEDIARGAVPYGPFLALAGLAAYLF